MSTTLVVSVTDELVAELEALAKERLREQAEKQARLNKEVIRDVVVNLCLVSPSDILALLSERAELKRDAERYRALRKACEPAALRSILMPRVVDPMDFLIGYLPRGLDAAIDAAMQSEAKQ